MHCCFEYSAYGACYDSTIGIVITHLHKIDIVHTHTLTTWILFLRNDMLVQLLCSLLLHLQLWQLISHPTVSYITVITLNLIFYSLQLKVLPITLACPNLYLMMKLCSVKKFDHHTYFNISFLYPSK